MDYQTFRQFLMKILGPILAIACCGAVVLDRLALYAAALEEVKSTTEKNNVPAHSLEVAPSASPGAAAEYLSLVPEPIPEPERDPDDETPKETPKPIGREADRAAEDGDRIDISGAHSRPPLEAKALSKRELKPLGEVDKRNFEKIKSEADACKQFNGKLIAFYDQTALIQDCKLRLIEDPLLLNIVRQSNKNQIRDVPASVYRLFKHGQPIRESDISGIEKALGLSTQGDNCKSLNKKYVTATGVTFYYIENCKKRKFLEYAGLEEHNSKKHTIKSITPAQLARIPDGPDMPNRGTDVADVWIKIDGDAGWQRASRPSANQKQDDSPQKLREIAKLQTVPVKVSDLCSEINGQLVSFYADVYYVEDCKLRKITEQTLDLQIKISGTKGVRDLSANEKRALKVGKTISAEAVLKNLHKSEL